MGAGRALRAPGLCRGEPAPPHTPSGITRSQRAPGPGLRRQLHPAPRGPPTRSSSGSSTQPGLGGRAALAAASGEGEEGLSPPCHPPPRLSERKVPRSPADGAGKVSACHRQNRMDGNHLRPARVTSHPGERCRRGVGAVTASHGANRADEGHSQKSTGLAADGGSEPPQAAAGRGERGQGRTVRQRRGRAPAGSSGQAASIRAKRCMWGARCLQGTRCSRGTRCS